MLGSKEAFAAVLVGMVLVGGLGRSAQAAQDDGSVTVEMAEYDGSGISGTATLTARGGAVVVDIALEGNVVGSHPAHIHEGTCDTMDPLLPVYPLADVDADGKSVTTVPGITLADVTAEPFVVNVHESVAELPVIISCGNFPVAGDDADDGASAGAATEEATGVGGGTPGEIPTTGVGSAIGMDGSNSVVLIVLSLLAVVLALAGIVTRRMEGRVGTARDSAV